MSLDFKPMTISVALDLARQYYDEKTYAHVLRVAGYVVDNKAIPADFRDECVCLAIMHDLLEDTDYKPYDIPENFKIALELLTKPKEMSYKEYCQNLQCGRGTGPRICAYFVKLADMKDHLNLKDTLTDKLKNKYLEGLAILL